MPKSKILIIDNEQDIVDTLTLMLQARDYSVCSAKDGQDGLDKAKNERPNLILLDIMTEGVDGYNVCMKLKSDRDTKNIPVVIISGKIGRDSIIKCHSLGVSDFIVKPFNLPTLLGKLGKFLDR
ncbi:MAG: two-component system, cell cycle response regulator [Candidatus Poribacteria bacterium]|nr:two-component system, cell cycle response regulator [Candidatus Poribacteria bacterium]